MQNIYFGTVFVAIVVYLLAAGLLFMQRKKGERSRMILASMTLFSVLNYVGMMVSFYIDPVRHVDSVMEVPFLLIGIFITTTYCLYPIEVVSPGWITWRRLTKLYVPVVSLWLLYRTTLSMGVDYTTYSTFGDMKADIGSFQVIFRIVLALLMFLPAVLLYWLPYTRRYNNTNHRWMNGYIAAITINVVSYLFANINDTFLVCSIYILISMACSLYITYQELFVRLIRQPIEEPQLIAEQEQEQGHEDEQEQDSPQPTTIREVELFERLEKYMNSGKAWRDPDLSAEKLTSLMYTNRTTLSKAIQHHGYDGYADYVNGKRVAEFIQIVNREGGLSYQQRFFDVGFRSKTTALRNFRCVTGTTPSEYFQKQTTSE